MNPRDRRIVNAPTVAIAASRGSFRAALTLRGQSPEDDRAPRFVDRPEDLQDLDRGTLVLGFGPGWESSPVIGPDLLTLVRRGILTFLAAPRDDARGAYERSRAEEIVPPAASSHHQQGKKRVRGCEARTGEEVEE